MKLARLFIGVVLAVSLLGQTTERYIVELDGDPAAVLASRGGTTSLRQRILDARGEVWGEQIGLLRILLRLGVNPIHNLDTLINGIVVEAEPRQVEMIERLQRVKGVYRVSPVAAKMDRALQLHDVERAWWWIGPENAGDGVKIGIIDSGIDTAHPGFDATDFTMPSGYPRGNSAGDLALTTAKVIVYRSYEGLFPENKRGGPEDCGGHGTSVAMCAAGVSTTPPYEPISGVAPRAYIGAYKAFPSCRSHTSSDVVLRAAEDAIRDGMDVLNLSLGHVPGERPEADLFALAVDRATALGVLVVYSAGNEGPMPATLGASGKFGENSLDVGASANDRVYSTTVLVDDVRYQALPGDGYPDGTITGPLQDVSYLDGNGLACDALPAGSLTGTVALILRGVCNFGVKLDNAEAAGAVGALIYSDDRDPVNMDPEGATLPGMMIANADGLVIKQLIPAVGTLDATLDFGLTPVTVADNEVVDFSSRGPAPGYLIKPDMVAVGKNVYTAASQFSGGSSDGFRSIDGTSFSSPIVAGAAAVVRSTRPKLTPRQVMSLLVNTADLIRDDQGAYLDVMDQGAGRLNLRRAITATIAASPVSVSFGANPAGTVTREVLLTNLDIFPDSYTVSVENFSTGPAPTVAPAGLDLNAGQSSVLTVSFAAAGLPPGIYQGVVRVSGTRTGAEIHIPYWLGVGSGTPDSITQYEHDVDPDDPLEPNSEHPVWVRINDEYGIAVTDQLPNVGVNAGDGEVLDVSFDENRDPALVRVDFKLGGTPGWHCFDITIADLGAQECFWLEE